MNRSSRNRRNSCADEEVCSIPSNERKKKLLQRPASLEITRYMSDKPAALIRVRRVKPACCRE